MDPRLRRAASSTEKTDDFPHDIVTNAVHVRDLQATVLHLFGTDDDERLTYRHERLDARLTGVKMA